VFLEEQVLGRNHGIRDLAVMQDGLAARQPPHIFAAGGAYEIQVERPPCLLRDADGERRPRPGIQTQESALFFMTEMEQVLVPGHVLGGRQGFRLMKQEPGGHYLWGDFWELAASFPWA